MSRLIVLMAGAAVLAGCSQFTSNDAERARLATAADSAAAGYLACMRQQGQAMGNEGANPVLVLSAAEAACEGALDNYAQAQKALLATQVMLTDKPVAAAVAALQKRGQQELAAVVTAPGGQAVAGVSADSPMPAASRPIPRSPSVWNDSQRVYLDCMLDQAGRYAAQNESAAVIADVAASRCRTHLGADADNQALLQEGRTLVMGAVMDARLAPQRR